MNQETKRQHIVPRYYLKSFTEKEGKIYVYDKKRKRDFESNYDHAGIERDFYTDDVFKDKQKNYEIEYKLSRCEASQSKIYKSILKSLNSKSFSYSEFYKIKAQFIEMIAIQVIRTPRVRRNIEMYFKNIISLPNFSKYFHLEHIEDDNLILEELKSILSDLGIAFFAHSGNTPIYTSDTPISTSVYSEEEQRRILTGSKEFGHPTFLLSFPLSSSYAVVLFNKNQSSFRDIEVKEINLELVQLLNYETFCNADRFVYSSEKIDEAFLEKMKK